jgi:hypothetical protein
MLRGWWQRNGAALLGIRGIRDTAGLWEHTRAPLAAKQLVHR